MKPDKAADSCVTGDFNGDGLADIACYSGANGIWAVALSTGSGFTSAQWANGPQPATPIGRQCFVGDFNGDGMTDLACYTGSGGAWAVSFSNGHGWDSQSPNWTGPSPAIPVFNACMTGDFNGDGMTDIACYTGSGTSWAMAFSTGTNFNNATWPSGTQPLIPLARQCFTGDFNGDGLTDFICYTGSNNQWAISLSKGKVDFATQQNWTIPVAPPVDPNSVLSDTCTTGDFNGDGLSDIACQTTTLGTWIVAISTGTGFKSMTWTGAVGSAKVKDQCFAGDATGDGLSDIVCYAGHDTDWGVSVSTGTSFPKQVWTSGIGPQGQDVYSNQCLAGDYNGDGRIDFACNLTPSSGDWYVGLAVP